MKSFRVSLSGSGFVFMYSSMHLLISSPLACYLQKRVMYFLVIAAIMSSLDLWKPLDLGRLTGEAEPAGDLFII